MTDLEKEWAMQKRETPELCERLDAERLEWEKDLTYDNIVIELKRISDNLHASEMRVNAILKKHGYKDLNDE